MIKILNKFIVLEGIDGSGKSTHARWIINYLRCLKIKSIHMREPGGCLFSENLRKYILENNISSESETLLIFSIRKENLKNIIWPFLKKKYCIISERFIASTYAYQGGGKKIGNSKLSRIENFVYRNFKPSFTYFFNINVRTSYKRLLKRKNLDRFENKKKIFHSLVKKFFYNNFKYSKNIFNISGEHNIKKVRMFLLKIINKLLIN